ncbi:hypothetical protein AVEN_56668-1 [Araneus ventricosus]|uniref:Uncharacterized protein n=1 Tax=Araneus ventricosus TaxID=182803 RepID=A0A4Y2LU31_ARAVE|nr:hypothetical protein AVEN_56668-1 [Araneus ventricosus]
MYTIVTENCQQRKFKPIGSDFDDDVDRLRRYRNPVQRTYKRRRDTPKTLAVCQKPILARFYPHKPSITGWQVTLSAFLLLVPEFFEKKKFVLRSRFSEDALENYFSQVRRMTILLQWTSCTRTRMLLAELMFAMCGNANYEPNDNIILESTQIILQTDEDCLDLVIDEPSWIAQKRRKIGMIWSSTVPLIWQATFQKNFRKSTVNSANQIYASNAATTTIIFLSFKEC